MTLLEATDRIRKILDKSVPGGSYLSELTRELVIKLKPGIKPAPEELEGLNHVFLSPNEIQITISTHPGLNYRKIDYERKPFFTFEEPGAILEYKEEDYLYFDPATLLTCSKFSKESDDLYFLNRYYSALTFEKLKIQEIFPYNDSTEYQLVLHSAEYGVQIVHYQNIYPKNSEKVDFKNNLESLKKNLERNEYVDCLKIHVCEKLNARGEPHQFSTIIENLGQILSDASKTYELFISKFSFTKLKEEFRTEKEKYFASLREIINQIISKTTGIPVTIAAAAISIYSLRDVKFLGFLVLLTYTVYSLFTSYLLKNTFHEVDEIKEALEDDLQKFTDACKPETDEFKEDRIRINQKILNARICIVLVQLILLFCTLGAIYLSYIVLKFNLRDVWWTIGGVIFSHLVIIVWTINKKFRQFTTKNWPFKFKSA